MSGINQDVVELLNELVERVVENEGIEREVVDVMDNVVERVGDQLEDEEDEEEEEMEEDEQDWPDQVGGANLRVHSKHVKESEGRFKGVVSAVMLQIEVPRAMAAHPNGPELFGEAVVRLVHQNAPPTGSQTKIKAGVVFESEELHQSVGFSFKEMSTINALDVVDGLEAMAQSNKSPLEMDVPRLSMRITYVKLPAGSGKRRYNHEKLLNEIAFEKRRRANGGDEDFEALHNNEDVVGDGDDGAGFIDGEAREARDGEEEDDDDDDFEDMLVDDVEEGNKVRSGNVMRNNVSKDCLPYALHQTMSYFIFKNNRTLANRKQYYDSLDKTDNQYRYTRIHKAVKEMKERAGVTKSTNFDFEDIERFQNTVFSDYQIVVFLDRHYTPYFQGPFVGKGRELYLLLENQHYRGVRTLPALFKTKYYCALCETSYRDVKAHYKCKLIHQRCGKNKELCPTTLQDVRTPCAECGITFRSQVCYDNHKLKGPRGGKSRCDQTYTCKKCMKPVYRNKNNRPHECGKSYCNRCQDTCEEGHHCSMLPSKKPLKFFRKRLYFDVESRADENGQQHPVLFVSLKCCPVCASDIPKDMESAKDMICTNCSPGGRLKVVECITPLNEHVDVGKEMTEYIFSPLHKEFVAVAHNASGYDGQFILENLIASNKAAPDLCLDGTKVVYLKSKGVKMLDSLRYLTMSLAGVGKTFNIESVKGDFPVNFIKPENFNYVGPLPPNEEYGLDNKSTAARKKLEKFLEEERASGRIFNFIEELLRYCYNDVFILASAMWDFETSFESMTEVCLLEESSTAASAAMKVFQRKHLKRGTIILDAKPAASGNASVASQKYLAWVGHKENIQINISTTYGEEKIGDYRVDGFIPPGPKYSKGKIIEYYGCYFHGHSCKYSDVAKIGDKTAKQIRRRDKKREKELKKKYPLEVVYECEVNRMLKMDKEMAAFFEDYEAKDLLHCERALVGGRTEVFKLYVDNNGQKLFYLDVVSLYPTVMKSEKFPTGEPTDVPRSTIITPITHPDEIKTNGVPFEGFVKCRVIPPRGLRVPTLPGKIGNRLMFALCSKCAKSNNQSDCTHTDEERSFNGTFPTPELKRALSRGYVVTEVHHAVKYDEWVENDAEGNGGLFTSYIKEMMIEKIYSSGYPSNVVTDEEKTAYRKSFEDNEHIVLNEPERFVKNAGKRAVAKLMLNSLWGKMAQRVDRENVEVLIKPQAFWRLMHDATLEIVDVRSVNDCMIVKYRKQVETLESLRTGAVHIAALVTSYARLRLLDLMEAVGGENIAYTDTDSIIFAVPEDQENPLADKIGSFFGQLTNEVEGEMQKFVTIGPKTYSYVEKLENGEEKTVRKAKGVTINSIVDKEFTFDLLKEMVDEVLEDRTPRTVKRFGQFTMRRNREHQVFAQEFEKQFRFTFNKRRILPDGGTLPFGF